MMATLMRNDGMDLRRRLHFTRQWCQAETEKHGAQQRTKSRPLTKGAVVYTV